MVGLETAARRSEDELVYVKATAEAVSGTLMLLFADRSAEEIHDLIDEVGARAHRAVDQARGTARCEQVLDTRQGND